MFGASEPSQVLHKVLTSCRTDDQTCGLVFQQMHNDVATGQIHAELQDGVAALEQLISELQERSAKLREQSQ